MPKLSRGSLRRGRYDHKFFSITLCHNDLKSYFKLNFDLMQHHGYSLEAVENLIPWEREVYINLLINHLKEEKEKIKNRRT